MKILALEFSSPLRSVALAVNGAVVASAQERGERGANPLALIDSVLRTGGMGRREIECLAVGLGPGSYAGIRIAIAIAQGWEMAGAVKLSGHSSAESVAAQAAESRAAFSIGVDAQRGELFVADYTVEAGGPRLMTPFRCLLEAEWRQLAKVTPLYRPDVLEAPDACMIPLPPTAATLALMAAHQPHFVPGHTLEPVYLRPADFVKAPPARFSAEESH